MFTTQKNVLPIQHFVRIEKQQLVLCFLCWFVFCFCILLKPKRLQVVAKPTKSALCFQAGNLRSFYCGQKKQSHAFRLGNKWQITAKLFFVQGKPIASWSCIEVGNFLKSINLPKYAKRFQEEFVDGEVSHFF